ncbi:MAG: DUF3795 domain-containing protein [Methanoregulaceae archaeon]|nr:DUF3795 domain-containing protein [Methanoregulaceae archaeon]
MEEESFPDAFGMCGVCCALAPCYRLGRCRGCNSDIRDQPRTSKFRCRIRTCVRERNLRHCGGCTEFPCRIRSGLEKRYLEKYGIDLRENIREITNSGPDQWMVDHMKMFTCPSCGDLVSPYTRECYSCRAILPH